MTRTGAVMGTPYYMSPEQAKGARSIDTRSDLYSVGVIIYEAVTGQVPFNAETFNELIFKIALEAPPPAESFVPNLDPAFAGIMRKAMAREPNERFQTAEEMRAVLGAWVTEYDAQARAAAAGPAILQGTVAMGPPVAAPTAVAPPPQFAGGTLVMESTSQNAPGEAAQTLVFQGGASPQQTTQRRLVSERKGSSAAIFGALAVLGLGVGGYFAYASQQKAPATSAPSATSATVDTALPSARTMPAPALSVEPTASVTAPEPASSSATPSAEPSATTLPPPSVPTVARPLPKPTATTGDPKLPKPARTITPELF